MPIIDMNEAPNTNIWAKLLLYRRADTTTKPKQYSNTYNTYPNIYTRNRFTKSSGFPALSLLLLLLLLSSSDHEIIIGATYKKMVIIVTEYIIIPYKILSIWSTDLYQKHQTHINCTMLNIVANIATVRALWLKFFRLSIILAFIIFNYKLFNLTINYLI